MIDGKDKFSILIHAPAETCTHYLFIIQDILNAIERACSNLYGSNLLYMHTHMHIHMHIILCICIYRYTY